MSFLGIWHLGDSLTFQAMTQRADTGVLTDADADPTYRVYEDETGTAILTGTMSRLDDPGTTGFYSEKIDLTASAGFEVDKTYTIYITAAVNGVTGGTTHTFQIEQTIAEQLEAAWTGSGGYGGYAGAIITAAQVVLFMSSAEVIRCTDDSATGSADEGILAAAINAGESDILSLIGQRYTLPLALTDAYTASAVRTRALDCVKYRLFQRRGVTDEVAAAYERAIEWAKAIRDGQAGLTGETALGEALAGAGGIIVETTEAIITDDAMEGA